MKKLIAICFMMLGMTAFSQTPAFGPDQHIQSTFNKPAGAVYCSTSVTTNCIVNYSLFITQPAGVTGGAIPVTIPASADDGTGLVTNLWQTSNSGLYCGTYGTSVVANWKDGSGTAASSNATVAPTFTENCTAPFTASPVTNLVSKPVK